MERNTAICVKHLMILKRMTAKETLKFYLENPDEKPAETNSHHYVTTTVTDLCYDRSWVLLNVGQNVNGTSRIADAY